MDNKLVLIDGLIFKPAFYGVPDLPMQKDFIPMQSMAF